MNKRREHEKQQKHTKIYKNQVQKEVTGRTSAGCQMTCKSEGGRAFLKSCKNIEEQLFVL
jgi:hypothetical protein